MLPTPLVPRFLCGALSGLLLFACQLQPPPPEQDPEIQPYVARFFAEAQQRGLAYDEAASRISYAFEETPFGGVCFRGENRFILNRTSWTQLTDRGKAFTVFHELGHCVLGRDHENGHLSSGECKSIMKGTEDGRRCHRNLMSERWRTYYVDELFDVRTLPPAWYSEPPPQQQRRAVATFERRGSALLATDLADFDVMADYELLATFEREGRSMNTQIAWGSREFSFSNTAGSLFQNESLRYLNAEWSGDAPGEIRLRQSGDLFYIYVENELFHVDEAVKEPFSSLRLEVDVHSGAQQVAMKLEVVQLE